MPLLRNDGELITGEDFRRLLRETVKPSSVGGSAPSAIERVCDHLVRPLREVERGAIETAMVLCRGDREKAWRRLQISRSVLFRKLRTYREDDNGGLSL